MGKGEWGVAGEDLACRELRRRGYVILARRYRTRAGEVDIVARDRQVLVFVEVKLRRTRACGTAGEAVTASKRRRLVTMAKHYLAGAAEANVACRFDVVAIDAASGRPKVEVITDAFGVDW